MSGGSFHSVTLDPSKCRGCTTCIRFCPTEAIRVRKGRAYIMDERCIDCGECIRACPHNAKKAVSDPLSALERFPVRVALPAPSLYGQFDERFSVDLMLGGLLALGFTDVFEVARAAELVSDATAAWIDRAGERVPGSRRPARPWSSSSRCASRACWTGWFPSCPRWRPPRASSRRSCIPAALTSGCFSYRPARRR